LAALGCLLRLWFRLRGLRRCRNGTDKLCNRTQHLPTITEDDTEIFQVLIGQVAKDGEIYAILSKTLRVLGHAEFCEPVRNLRRCAHISPPVVTAEPGLLRLPLSHTPATMATSMANLI
jgi:hypothetical protein